MPASPADEGVQPLDSSRDREADVPFPARVRRTRGGVAGKMPVGDGWKRTLGRCSSLLVPLFRGEPAVPIPASPRSEERRVGTSVSVSVNFGGRRLLTKKKQ